MRDSVGVVMLGQGNDPADFTEDDFNAAIAELQAQIDSGQIRQVSGNDYIAALETGDVVAAIGWSGDVAALGDPYKFVIPESGGTLWTDNMLVPAMARHKNNAERLMDYYYDPAVSAELAAWVQYICPVKGAQEEMAKIDAEPGREPLHLPDGGRPRRRSRCSSPSPRRSRSSTTRPSRRSSATDHQTRRKQRWPLKQPSRSRTCTWSA